MKKQNQNNKLLFNKSVITELNDDVLKDLNGGGGDSAASFIASVALSYAITKDLFADH
ncbi:class I lanthipeptide [Flavobacterium sp. LAR06]|uniref:class I lanthipeptide n=1 Tax=Flavobacterium sp. LAR06 TaxID=3064897 RepID=UPI0035BF1461